MWGTAICAMTMLVLQGGNPRALQRQSLASLRAPTAPSREGAGCCLHRIRTRALVAVSKKVSGQRAGGILCFKGWGGRCKAQPQTNETLEKPFISGRWRSEPQSGSNKKLLSVGSYSQSRARGAGVGVLGSMLCSSR